MKTESPHPDRWRKGVSFFTGMVIPHSNWKQDFSDSNQAYEVSPVFQPVFVNLQAGNQVQE